MNNLYETIGRRIRELRSAYGVKGLSQEELAELMNTTANTISRWESAVYKPSAMDLLKLSKIFHVNISVFFPESEMPKHAALTSALGELKKDDLEDVAEYAQFRLARQRLKEAEAAKRKKK